MSQAELRILYLVEIDVQGPLDPDDARPLADQADELVDGICAQVNEAAPGAVWAEPIRRWGFGP